jgi:hypothetical protein
MGSGVKLDLGLIVVVAVPVEAFAGAHGRVYPSEDGALIDLATTDLANLWLRECTHGSPSFAQIMTYIEMAPDVFEAAVKLARFKL